MSVSDTYVWTPQLYEERWPRVPAVPPCPLTWTVMDQIQSKPVGLNISKQGEKNRCHVSKELLKERGRRRADNHLQMLLNLVPNLTSNTTDTKSIPLATQERAPSLCFLELWHIYHSVCECMNLLTMVVDVYCSGLDRFGIGINDILQPNSFKNKDYW